MFVLLLLELLQKLHIITSSATNLLSSTTCQEAVKIVICMCVQAMLFFALPGGSGLEYNLSGTAEPPKPINRIAREVPCKTEYTEPLTVENWLSKPQRSAFYAQPSPMYYLQ